MTPAATWISLQVNGRHYRSCAPPDRRLADVLRDEMGLSGTKIGCNAGDCGACTVLLDGAPICACLTPLGQAEGREVLTVEGLEGVGLGHLQHSFLAHGAAQCGICTPGMLMAAAALLRRIPHPGPDQAQEALSGVLCRCTGYARIIKAVCHANDPRSNTPPPPERQAVGISVPRLDGMPKCDGSESFGADPLPPDLLADASCGPFPASLDDSLMVRAIRSPHHHAQFTFGDLATWQARHPGIEAVLTARDIPGRNCFGVIPAFADQPVLAEGRVRFRGEAVALVAGDQTAVAAFDPADFPVSWHPLPALMDCVSARAEEAPLVHPDRAGNLLIAGRVCHGNAEDALAGAAHVAQAEVETAFVEHAYIEPEAGIAWLADEGGKQVLIIRACTQAPVMDRDACAEILALPEEQVRIIPSATGGGFGGKLDVSLQPLIGLATLHTGKPCRMVYSRRESMMSTTKRHPARMHARIGCDHRGRLAAMVFEGDFNTGAHASWGPTVAGRVPVHASGPYRMAHYHAEARAIHTNGPPSGAFRGFGVPQAAIIQEMLFDDLAARCGIDRLTFRLRNALDDGDRTRTGQCLETVGIRACLKALEAPWKSALAAARSWNAAHDETRRGVGIAGCWYGCGNTALPNPSTIRAGITPKGRVCLHQGATDIGQGANTVIAQIFAEALGLPLSEIVLIGPDTAHTPDAGKTSASRQTCVSGRAALACGQSLRARILRRLNMGENAELSLSHGTIIGHENGKEARLDPTHLPPGKHGYVLMAEETHDPPTTPLDENGQGVPYAIYGWGAQMAEVEVNTTTGRVRVRHVHAAHDLGRAINPSLAEGQIEGGIAQGIGLALMEEYIPGHSENLHDYLIPTTGDMPEITPILIERPDPEGPFGARGLGEHVLIPTAPAILNAIRHACGARITRLPALPHRVLAAIRQAGENGK